MIRILLPCVFFVAAAASVACGGGRDAGPPEIVVANAGADVSKSDGGAALGAARIAAIRRCMEGRWGASPGRLAIDVAEDFDACTSAAENHGRAGDASFAAALDGWADPDPDDHSRMHRLAAER